MKSKRWKIIFDYDDTLIRHDSKRELKYVAEYLGLEFNTEFYRQLSSFYSKIGNLSFGKRITKKKIRRMVISISAVALAKRH